LLDAAATSALVAAARRGERRAFESLARAHLRACYAVALAVLGSAPDAEDVAQDALVAAFDRLDDCREPERFSGWLTQIARNRARNALDARRLRDRGRETHAQEPSAEPAPLALRARLLKSLSQLTEVQREVVLLHDLEGFTHPEIGAALGLSEVASRQHLFVARRTLRGHLQAETPEEVSHGR
jgi:RNA polymerase sigma-70 factor (ECF subfamily)